MTRGDNGTLAEKRSAAGFAPDDAPAPDKTRSNMMIASHGDGAVPAPTPTTYRERRDIILSLCNHREPGQMLCTLVVAAAHGASLMTLVQIEASRDAVTG